MTKFVTYHIVIYTTRYPNRFQIISGHLTLISPFSVTRMTYRIFFSVKGRNLFHGVGSIGNTFTRGAATSENNIDVVHEMKSISIFHQIKNKNSVYFMLLTFSGRRFIKIHVFNPFRGEALSKSSTVFFRYSPWRTPPP